LKQAVKTHNESIKELQDNLCDFEERIYNQAPAILVNNITSAALPEEDMIALHNMSKDERKRAKITKVDNLKLKLFTQFSNKEITLDELKEKVK
jgi:uncharacterized protein (DUF342 family)